MIHTNTTPLTPDDLAWSQEPALLTLADVMAAVAYWAQQLTPYPFPPHLEKVLDQLYTIGTTTYFNARDVTGNMRYCDYAEFTAWLTQALQGIPQLLAWTKPAQQFPGYSKELTFTYLMEMISEAAYGFISFDCLVRNTVNKLFIDSLHDRILNERITQKIMGENDDNLGMRILKD